MKVIFVRHGKTREGKDKEGLIKEGKKQALLLAKKFKNVKISKIYSSDLKRAKETAKIGKSGQMNKIKIS